MKKRDLTSFFGQVLKEARLNAELSQEDLALESNLDRTYVSMLERGVKTPTLSTLVKLSKALSLTPASLINRAQQLEMGVIPPNKKLDKTLMKPPFYGTSISCGKPISEEFEIEKELSLDSFMIKNAEETFFVKASGDSMMPTIWDGDLLILNTNLRPKNGSIVLVQIQNEFSIKRFFRTSKGIKLIPDNANFKEISLKEPLTAIICGIVVGITRSFQ